MEQFTEKEAEDFLEKNKFKVAKRTFVKEINELKKIKIHFPWVMKISSKKIMHKAKSGGVITNINNMQEAEKAFQEISKQKYFQEAIIQETIIGEELIIGIKNTSEFGNTIMIGAGGTNVEKTKDVSFRINPITKKQAQDMIKELKIYEQLKAKKINFKKITETLLKISKLSEKNNIEELDINPLFVNKDAIIADARIIFASKILTKRL